MKRTLLKIYAVVIAFSLMIAVASCGGALEPIAPETGTEPADGPVTLTLWRQMIGQANPGTDSFENIIEEWNNGNPDVKIRATYINGEGYTTRIKTALASREAPDLFYMWGDRFIDPYIKTDNILALDPYLEDGTKEKLKAGMLEACTFDGKIYSLPLFTYIANLYCNTELFDKAGAKIPETYGELLDAVKVLRTAGVTPVVLGEKDRWPGMYWFAILAMRQSGAQNCLNAMYYPTLFYQQDYLAAAEKLKGLVEADAFNRDMFMIGYRKMLEEFTSGNAAMMYQGNWVDAVIEDEVSALKGKVTAVPFPVLEGGKGNTREFLGGNIDGFYINADTAYKREAVEALKYISEKTGKKGYLKGEGLPCWKTDELDNSKLPALARQSAELNATGNFFVGWWDTIMQAASTESCKNLVAELLGRKITPVEFTEEMVKLKGVSY